MGVKRGKVTMIANHIHDALGQVRTLRELILERQKFRGYSGVARMAGGVAALVGAVVLAGDGVPATVRAHLLGWGVVLAVALLLNYGGLLTWVVNNPEVRRSPLCLMPVLDAVPALAVGAVLSYSAVRLNEYGLLFGLWMACYGLCHMPYRHSLPVANYWVGVFYMVVGCLLLLWPGVSFVQPWPMGVVFCVGELAGGWILHRNRITTAEDKS